MPDSVRVFCERVGGGFGGKQEVLTEDICAFATLKTGRPVKLEFTREEEFIAATTRHPMNVEMKVGARRDGTLTAMQMRVVSNTGAYGNHGGETLYAACGEAVAVYRCPNKKVDGYTVYTNMVPAGAIRGYGMTQTIFAVECAMDEVARSLKMDPYEFRRINVVKPGDQMIAESTEATDTEFGSYGLDQCIDLVQTAMMRGNGVKRPRAPTGSRAVAWRSRCTARCRRPSIVRRRGLACAKTATITWRSALPSSATARPRFTADRIERAEQHGLARAGRPIRHR